MPGVATVTVKEIPSAIHETLKKLAEDHGQSLNSYILSILSSTTDERMRRLKMRDSRAGYARFLAGLEPMSNSVELIREGRD